MTGKTKSTYKNGIIRASVSYDGDGNILRRNEYTSYGDMTLEELYDSDGDIKYKTETKYEYDQFGNHTLVAKYNTDGKLVDKTQCENYQIVYIGG